MQLKSYQTIVEGTLQHSGHTYEQLAQTYGTPLYIFDEESFRERVLAYKHALENPYFEAEVLFASKALLTRSIARLIAELGIGQDVVSSGEIYTSIQSGVPASKMYMHGNNKGNDELDYALQIGIGTIVVDNRMEAARLNQLAIEHNVTQRVLLRLNSGVEAHTHDYIQTATLDSKFGESVFDPEIYDIIQMIAQASNLDFAGFHSHIGSQIFEKSSFLKAVEALIKFSSDVQRQLNVQIREIDFGGGFGVYYTDEDQPFVITEFLPELVEYIYQTGTQYGVNLERMTIEPGRSLVNDSGSTLYRVGDLKHTVGGKNYVFIDGGMSDNIRPALYQAKYEALIVNKAEERPTTTYTIAGKACESGDKIIEDYPLPNVEAGDLLLVNGTGAYNYTMASNYNRLARPAMIHVNGGTHRLTVKRETFEDMMRNEL